MKYLSDLINFIIPYLEVKKGNAILEYKYNQILNKEYEICKDDKFNDSDELFLNDLYKYQIKELDRRFKIEDKGKSMLFVITLSTTFLLGSINFIYQFKDQFNPILLIILIIAIIFLILSIISVINVVKIKPHHDLYLFDKYNINHITLNDLKEDKIIKNINKVEDDKKILTLIKSIELNECLITQKSDSLDCTFALIERSIILIAIFVISLMINIHYDKIINCFVEIFNLLI